MYNFINFYDHSERPKRNEIYPCFFNNNNEKEINFNIFYSINNYFYTRKQNIAGI